MSGYQRVDHLQALHLEIGHIQRRSELRIVLEDGQHYQVDLVNSTQTELATGRTRSLRRSALQ